MKPKSIQYIGVVIIVIFCCFVFIGCGQKEKRMKYDFEYDVRVEPKHSQDIAPGLYCVVAKNQEEGLFNLVMPLGGSEDLLRSQTFKTHAWVEVKEGERLLINKAKLFTEAERKASLRDVMMDIRDGFFKVGEEVMPGYHMIKGLPLEEGQQSRCEVYSNARSFKEGPLRTYEVLTDSFVDVEVVEGEFLLLENAEIYIPQG